MVSEPKIKGRDDEKLSTESLVTVSAMIPIKRMSKSYIDKHVYWLMDMEISVDKLIRIQFKKKTKVFVAFLTADQNNNYSNFFFSLHFSPLISDKSTHFIF